ncbi:MAG TPA: HYR domain-containing protein [Candidatus Acidoferrum sp.]|nr:HYR domain-containing protein [Candidatus Acidoferrum sp.]
MTQRKPHKGHPVPGLALPRRRALACWMALLAGAAVGLAQGPAGGPARQALQGHVPEMAKRLAPTGRLPGNTPLHLAISLPARHEPELNALLLALYDPASPLFHHYLSPEQFAERFGASEADYQAVIAFARANGLKVAATHPNRLVLSITGSARDIESAFHITLQTYPHPSGTRTFYAPGTEPSLDLAVPIAHISGLDNYDLPHPLTHIHSAGPGSRATPSAGSGPSSTYLGYDFRSAYVPGTPLNGQGQSIGLLQFDGFYTNDITAYEDLAGLPHVPLLVVPVDGGVTNIGSGAVEVSLDIEMAVSMAPGLSQVYVFEATNPAPWVDLLTAMLTYTNIHQFSCSWSGGSPDPASETLFKEMAAQGQSFFCASGDSDAFTGSIPFPCDSTNIVSVGGTTLTTGTGAAYSSETAWNWGYDSNCGCYVGTSGGISPNYRIPNYQTGVSMSANKGSTTFRNIPDVALTADNIYVIYGNGLSETVGGTSCASPLWAALTALINQQAAGFGQPPVGFLNPALYTIGKSAKYAACFHDITSGNNYWPSSPSKFPAVSGYDLCTGWGTPNGTNLINALAPPPVPLLVSNSFTLLVESCTNGVVDPGEAVTVSLGLQNVGTANTVNLVATLLATNGILSPGAPQTYGLLLTNGGAVAQPFSFTTSGNCGDTNIVTLQLQDGSANLGAVSFAFRLGQLVAGTIFSQNFESVTAPNLPAGWSTSATNAQSPWVTSTAAADTSPNSAFSADPGTAGVNELDSPVIGMPAGTAQLSFRNNYNMQSGRDGGVLEILIGGGAWTDIQTAGGVFASGGYNGRLSSNHGNPLGGRSAWTGNSGGFITTLVNLPAAASGQSIQLRWRCATDNTTSGVGWYVDTVSITGTNYTCCTVNITSQPQPQNVCPGSSAVFSVAATGAPPLSYQWQTNGVNLTEGGHFSGVATSNLLVTAVDASVLAGYRCVVSNQGGSEISSAAALTDSNTVPPSITCPPQVIVSANFGCSATNVALGTPPATSDNCGVLSVTNNAPALYPLGTNYVTWTVTDTSGNTNSCAQRVIVRDTTPPVITLNGPNPATNECHAPFADPGAAGSDACAGTVAIHTNSTVNPNSAGAYTIQYTATDPSGNAATNTRTVYIVDTTPPVITWFTNAVLAADTNCQAWMPDLRGTNYILAVDTCSSVTVTQSVATNTLLSLGTNTVVLATFDAAGNVAYCTNYVLVVDTTPPVLACPPDLSVLNDPGQCGAVVYYTAPAGQDTCSSVTTTQVAGLASGAFFPLGRTTNTFQATDGAGNSALCSFVVTVADAEPPAITWFTNAVLAADTNCQASMPDLTGTNYILAADTCSSVTVTQSVATNTPLGLGTNTIVLAAFDAAGNTTYCTNYVLVLDETPPVIICPSNLAVFAGDPSGALVSYDVSAVDNCDPSPVVMANPPSGSFFPVGTNVVNCTAIDVSGNTNLCGFSVTVYYCPKLSIEIIKTDGLAQVQVCWPEAGPFCALQSTADLTPPVQWQPVDLSAIFASDGTNCLTITNLTTAAFYRLCGGGP